jgi:hypothetical protein
MDDRRFEWRVKGALVLAAVAHADDEDVNSANFAKHILTNPLGPAGAAPAIVAANPVVAGNIVVDDANGVNTEGVTDGDIEFIVADNWDILLEHFSSNAAVPDPFASQMGTPAS